MTPPAVPLPHFQRHQTA